MLASVLTSTSVLLTWDPPPLSHRNGIITEYNITFIEVGSSNVRLFTTTTNKFNVSMLSPYTLYNFAVSAITSVGMGPLSNYTTLQTLQDGKNGLIIIGNRLLVISAPSAAPLNVIANSVLSRSFILSWQLPLSGSLNGVLTGFRIAIMENQTGNVFYNSTYNTSFTLNNLHPFHTYHCAVAAVTVSVGPFSDVTTVQTAQDGKSIHY